LAYTVASFAGASVATDAAAAISKLVNRVQSSLNKLTVKSLRSISYLRAGRLAEDMLLLLHAGCKMQKMPI